MERIRNWWLRRSVNLVVRRICKRQRIEVPQDPDAFAVFVDELILVYQIDEGLVSEFGDGQILDSITNFAQWLIEFAINNADEIVRIISLIISLFEESPE